MTANVITYRGRSAMREIGKALNFPPDVLDRFSHLFAIGDFPHTLELEAQIAQSGISRAHPRAAAAVGLYRRIYGLPRHLGQHCGGMIICQGQLSGIVPLENASMPGRVVAQWDKDDCEDLGIIKVDLLGLGHDGGDAGLARNVRGARAARGAGDDSQGRSRRPSSCCAAADTIGTFQVESRAQMATLPRMQPREFYDVVVEVAHHPARPDPGRHGASVSRAPARARKRWSTIDERLRPVLERTLGVPLFQEQLLKIAMVMADFSGERSRGIAAGA